MFLSIYCRAHLTSTPPLMRRAAYPATSDILLACSSFSQVQILQEGAACPYLQVLRATPAHSTLQQAAYCYCTNLSIHHSICKTPEKGAFDIREISQQLSVPVTLNRLQTRGRFAQAAPVELPSGAWLPLHHRAAV